ncbi:hypothetical protein GCM10010329_02680 [Streptomyces spiroverticillatus]|nr:hypothetical protein GCM10010329_02680 [Streptomyces spiroverticillatus]
MYRATKAPIPNRQSPKNVPSTFFQVKSRRMPLFRGARDARREPPDCRALRSSARPMGQSLRISVITRHTHRTFAGSAQKANTAGSDI